MITHLANSILCHYPSRLCDSRLYLRIGTGRSNVTILTSVVLVKGKPVADEEKKELQIDFRFQSGPQTAVDQDEDRTRGIEILAHMIQLQ